MALQLRASRPPRPSALPSRILPGEPANCMRNLDGAAASWGYWGKKKPGGPGWKRIGGSQSRCWSSSDRRTSQVLAWGR